jgi:hypothetical protein
MWEAYSETPIGADGWLDQADGTQSLEEFQHTLASAEEWESVGLIEILVKREESRSGRQLVDALQFRRLK